MKTKLNFRSVVFQRAYRIVKETGCNFSEALKEAWKRYRAYKEKVAQEIADRINNFDFYYYYSDDSGVYRRWTSIKEDIREQVRYHSSFIAAIIPQLSNHSKIKYFV